ncbi:hypothetical protein, partial [Pseudomonas weihenstephanensis]|uniref:hypothetical protein n=1 Tax=Pseudomonas weihenstephanensis TaxID=1608994 RepID=UPI001EEDF679
SSSRSVTVRAGIEVRKVRLRLLLVDSLLSPHFCRRHAIPERDLTAPGAVDLEKSRSTSALQSPKTQSIVVTRLEKLPRPC